MRYASGILFGAILPAIIFAVLAALKLASHGVIDPGILAALWGFFLVWVAVSVVLLVTPPIAVLFMDRALLREVLLYEGGGLALFTPIWFSIATELSGGSWLGTLLSGVKSALPVLGEGWVIVGADIGPVILIPSFCVMILLGLIVLRPSFIKKHSTPAESRPPAAPKEKPAAAKVKPAPRKVKPTAEGESIEVEMPGVAAPVPDERSVSELKSLLTEIGAPDAVTRAILEAGIATVTDLVATSSEQLAAATGIDRKTAEDLHTAVQKKVWFGGI